MGVYSEYLDQGMDFASLTAARKTQLNRISSIRGGRDILVMAADLMKSANTSIDYSDIVPFQDQLSNLSKAEIDIIIETPGGFAEVVEDLVGLVRQKYEKVGIIVPGYAKSAGTIFAMAGDEILMGKTSAMGPIDAQILSQGKRFSADAFLDGLEKIKEEVVDTGKLNPALIPILQNISPGEIQHCENAQGFSRKLVTKWLSEYKFKYWTTHSGSGKPVTEKEKSKRAQEIARRLCKHSDWLTHGRSIKMSHFAEMRLTITDYSEKPELNEAIMRYYTLLRMTFETTNIYKLFETTNSQIYRFSVAGGPQSQQTIPSPINKNDIAIIDFECPNCHTHSKIQANLDKESPLQLGAKPYPTKDNTFVCPKCRVSNNILPIKIQIEAQSGKKVV